MHVMADFLFSANAIFKEIVDGVPDNVQVISNKAVI